MLNIILNVIIFLNGVDTVEYI